MSDDKTGIRRIADTFPMSAMDVGARRGVSSDLLSIAPGVDVFAFEPDPEEHRRLAELEAASPWRSVTVIQSALGATPGEFELNLYRQRGCSSKFLARQEKGRLFSRGDYYIHDGTVTVPVRPLDQLVSERRLTAPSFMKIDVQGMEVEVFQGGRQTLSDSLLGVRTEVSFFPLYEEQPLFAEVDQTLRSFGLYPMRWIESHAWRRNSRKKLPTLGPEPMPYSFGQLMHGDLLYMAMPEDLDAETEEQMERLIHLGLISTCYEMLDHAHAAFDRGSVREYCRSRSGIDPIKALYSVSREKARDYKGFRKLLRRLRARR